jgi:hypothetical protein
VVGSGTIGVSHSSGDSQAQVMEELEHVESAMEKYKHWSANALRSECRRLKTTPASLNKASYLAALRSCLLVTGTIVATGVVQSPFRQAMPDRKTVDCVFRLLNVLFSDSFCAGVASLGDVATRHALDTHTTGNASPWFEAVTTAYNDEDDESFNALLHVLPEFSSIDPAAFKQHNSKKLWAMWKEITRDYREADARFRKSGNNGIFAGFHGGKMDVYYLHLLTTITKPNLHACVVQTLPEGIMADSLDAGSGAGKTPGKAVAGGKGETVRLPVNTCGSLTWLSHYMNRHAGRWSH